MTNSIPDFLASIAAIFTILTAIFYLLQLSSGLIKNRLRKVSNVKGSIIMSIWLSFLLVFLLTSSKPITRIDVFSIALLTCLLFVVMMRLSYDLNEINHERKTKQKHDLFALGEHEKLGD